MTLISYFEWEDSTKGKSLGEEAYQTYQSGVDNDITIAAEEENGLYHSYIERMAERLDKHKANYDKNISGSTPTDVFIKDIEITKRLMEDFIVYMDRFIKQVMSASKKKAN